VNALVFGDQVNSTRFCTRVINLPIFAGMTDEELSYVVSMVEKTLKEAQA
jgi:dTDP-4-amino-4,6-dideoxygalactose transaminase